MKKVLNLIYFLGRLQLGVTRRSPVYSKVVHYLARGIYFIMTGVFPEEFYKARRDFRARTAVPKTNQNKPVCVNENTDLDLHDIQKYLDKEYWEDGTKTGKSGYSGIHALMGIADSVGFQFTEVLNSTFAAA